MLRKILIALFLLALLSATAAGVVGFWAYRYVTRDLPDFHRVEDYRPNAVSTVYSNDGTPIAEFYDERRYPVKIAEVPLLVRNAFLAAEDAQFYSHTGIDPVSIARAALKNLRAGSASQGGSTITQQVVKNLLLTPEKKIIRKVKEAILSYRLEKRLSKDGILEIYLNQIFFGNGAYGIKAAAKIYFHKNLDQLTLAESALLAAFPKAPSRYSPLQNPQRAKRRQRYVLDQMVKAGFISRQEAESAEKDQIKVFPVTATNIFSSPYYVTEVRRVFTERWKEFNLDTDGLKVYTALDLTADQMATEALRRGLREVDRRRGWRGPVTSLKEAKRSVFIERYGSTSVEAMTPGEPYPALVTEVVPSKKIVKVDLGAGEATIDLRDSGWAKKGIDREGNVSWIIPENVIRPGDVIEVAVNKIEEVNAKDGTKSTKSSVVLSQSPEVEGALALIDPLSGRVVSTVGGYSYQRSVFNRVTQSYRQPGSSFKPIVYLSAVDKFGYTPSTIVHDSPRTFKIGTEYWTPGNFDGKFLGAIPLQVALERSRNLVSAQIVAAIGIDAVISYARRLGITSKMGRNLSISLGSSEVTLLELVRAYGVFASKGVIFPSTFITKIEDRDGRIVYDYNQEAIKLAQQVVDPNSAFIMAHMMRGVVERGTAYKVHEIKRPVAGKTGTSNDQMDAWFIGYTPNWVAGVWVGFDVKKEIGDKETGGKAAAPIWLNFMREFLDHQDRKAYERAVEEAKAEAERLGVDYVAPDPILPVDFTPTDDVDPFWINKETGLRAEQGEPGAILEYFRKGTAPPSGGESEDATSYLESSDL